MSGNAAEFGRFSGTEMRGSLATAQSGRIIAHSLLFVDCPLVIGPSANEWLVALDSKSAEYEGSPAFGREYSSMVLSRLPKGLLERGEPQSGARPFLRTDVMKDLGVPIASLVAGLASEHKVSPRVVVGSAGAKKSGSETPTYTSRLAIYGALLDIEPEEPFTVASVAKAADVVDRTVHHHMHNMREGGIVEAIPDKRRTLKPAFVYSENGTILSSDEIERRLQESSLFTPTQRLVKHILVDARAQARAAKKAGDDSPPLITVTDVLKDLAKTPELKRLYLGKTKVGHQRVMVLKALDFLAEVGVLERAKEDSSKQMVIELMLKKPALIRAYVAGVRRIMTGMIGVEERAELNANARQYIADPDMVNWLLHVDEKTGAIAPHLPFNERAQSALEFIHGYANGATIRALATRFHTDPRATGIFVNKMVKAGLVTVAADPLDSRLLRVYPA